MPIRLDQRLMKIACLIDRGSVADIGCDHGKLGYYLVSTDRASKVVATDISKPSLEKAIQLAHENGVDGQIETRLGDGLNPVESGEVDTVVIAGMGGDTIAKILQEAKEQNKVFQHFVLAPNTHAEKVRRQLLDCGHTIDYDDVLECAGKTYTIIKTHFGESSLDEMQIKYGVFFRTSETFARRAREELEGLKAIEKASGTSSLKEKISALETVVKMTEKAD